MATAGASRAPAAGRSLLAFTRGSAGCARPDTAANFVSAMSKATGRTGLQSQGSIYIFCCCGPHMSMESRGRPRPTGVTGNIVRSPNGDTSFAKGQNEERFTAV